MQLCIGNN